MTKRIVHMLRKPALVAGFLLSASAAALAQTYPGQFPAGTVFGNSTGSTAAPIPGQVTGNQITSGTVTNANHANMAAGTVKCNATGATAAPQDCNALGQELPSVLFYGATPAAGAAANSTAITSAESAALFQYGVPNGTYATNTNFLGGAVTQEYVGPGIFTDASGNTRGRWIAPWTHATTASANVSTATAWLNSDNSQLPFNIERIITAPVVTSGSLVTNGTTALGNNVLHFASVPSWVGVGANISFRALQVVDATAPSVIPGSTYVVSTTPTTVTLSANVTGAGVGSGDTISFGADQFIDVPEAATVLLNLFAANGSLSNNTGFAAAPGASAVEVRAINDSGTPGLLGGLTVNCQVTRAWPGYSASFPFVTPTCYLLAGQSTASAANVYLNPVEWLIGDNGNATTGIGLVLDFARTFNTGGAQQFWNAIRFNPGQSTKALDGGLVLGGGGGGYNYGIDFSLATLTGTPGQGIAFKSNQGIYWNATAGTYGATAPGTAFTYYNGSLFFQTNGASGFEFTNAHATAGDFNIFSNAGPTLAGDTTTVHIVFRDAANTTTYGSIARATASAVVYNTTSDGRLKDVIGDSEHGLDLVRQLHVRDFTWKSDPEKNVVHGFVAQEVGEVYPFAVHVGGDDPQMNPWGVDYGRLTPLLVKAVQQLDARLGAVERKTR